MHSRGSSDCQGVDRIGVGVALALDVKSRNLLVTLNDTQPSSPGGYVG